MTHLSDICSTIEQLDPGHFQRRRTSLEQWHKKYSDLGFFPLQISESDIYCYQLTFDDKRINTRGKVVGTSITLESLEDALENESFMQTLKDVLRYDGTT